MTNERPLNEYIDLVEPNKLKLEVYYSKGGMNYFNYKQEPRGYYGSVTPCKVYDGMEQFTLGKGLKTFLLACDRRSNKKAEEAIQLFNTKKQSLIDQVLISEDKSVLHDSICKRIGLSIPRKFEGYTEQQIRSLPVQIVDESGVYKYLNLNEVQDQWVLSTLCGPMYGEVDGKPALRFESQKMNQILSA